jgi:hypothetical protein
VAFTEKSKVDGCDNGKRKLGTRRLPRFPGLAIRKSDSNTSVSVLEKPTDPGKTHTAGFVLCCGTNSLARPRVRGEGHMTNALLFWSVLLPTRASSRPLAFSVRICEIAMTIALDPSPFA